MSIYLVIYRPFFLHIHQTFRQRQTHQRENSDVLRKPRGPSSQALAHSRSAVDVHAEVAFVLGVGGVHVVALPDGALEVLGHHARVVADADLREHAASAWPMTAQEDCYLETEKSNDIFHKLN